ncbi:MAG: hypothetical protein SVU88_04965 [Candidatus Nanohaloarchaea archaeon]|nr:hypothetical protein [Candidatus Nanohaloarchaea archaeon]
MQVTGNRLAMYGIYTVVAAVFYEGLFRLVPGAAPLVALAVTVLWLVKDLLVDQLLLRGTPAFYRFLEHNPFNYVLIAGILVGRFDAPGAVLGLDLVILVPLLALVDLLVDGLQDARVEFGV